MARPKGSKNKGPIEEKGNPEFNIKDAEPVVDWQEPGTKVASGAVTEADLAFDREIQAMNQDAVAGLSDRENYPEVRKTKEQYTLLSEYVDGYKPATTLRELDDQTAMAKHHECDSIEATRALVRFFDKSTDLDKVGYIIRHNIKVYIEGFFDQSSKRDKQTTEQRNFGASKIP